MRGGLAHHNLQAEAVLREYTHARTHHDEGTAQRIRLANTDLTKEFDRIDAHAVETK